MIAQSNWVRPIYVASTVGQENYMNLGDNFVQEGLANRITPFTTNAPGAKNFDTQKTYNNVMNRYKYGGLSRKGIYIDETVMRMCYTHRRIIAQLALHLISEGDLGSIPEAMERGNPAEGVFTFDHSIFELYESGVISFQDAINYVESENNFRIRIRAQSNRRLPPEMQSRGEIFSVKSDDALSRELMRKDREERERLRKEGKL